MTEPIHLRASSVSTLFDCPARWEAIHIEGVDMPSSGAAWLGTAIHHSTAVFDQATVNGEPITIDDAAGELLDTLRNPREEIRWTDITPREAETAGIRLNMMYCRDIAPHQDYTLVEHTLNDLVIDLGDDISVKLTGTLDRIRKINGELGVADVKSGVRAVDAEGRANTIAHVPQLGVYELLAEYATGQEMTANSAIIGLKTKGEPAAAITELSNCKQKLLHLYLPAVKMYFERGIFPGNPRSQLCSNRYCPTYNKCQWRG